MNCKIYMENRQSYFYIFISFIPYISIGYVFENIVICRLDNKLTVISTTETKSSLVEKVPSEHFGSSVYECHVTGPQ